MLEVKGLRKSFAHLEVLKGINLSIQKGDVISIIGPSGSGKTTLLRCLNFLEKADDGELTFDKETYQMAHISHRDVLNIRKKTAFVFQNYNLFLNKTALENITEGLIVGRKMPKALAYEIGQTLLKRIGLFDRGWIARIITQVSCQAVNSSESPLLELWPSTRKLSILMSRHRLLIQN